MNGSLWAQTIHKMSDPSPSGYVQTGDLFYDSGGSSNYTDYEDETITFTVPVGFVVKVVFESFNVENQTNCDYDWLKAFDGNSTSSDLFGTYCGTSSPGTVISSDRDLTFEFHSDFSEVRPGWKATIEVLSNPCSAGSDPIWVEDFESSSVKGNSTTNKIKRQEYPNTGSEDWGMVGSNIGSLQSWESSSIDISNFTDIRVSMDLGSWGNNMENADYLRIYYSVDGGNDVFFLFNGTHTNDISAQTTCSSIPEGNELTLKVVMRNSANNEYYYVDNIIVSGETKRPDAVSLSLSPSSIDEYDGTANITASIFEAQTSDVTVHLNYSGADASNYSGANQIVIPAGSTSANITFSATDNDILDGDRDVLIAVSSVNNGVESGTQEQTITIIDDEELSEIQIPFQQRTSQNTPTKKIYNIKGDFTMIGNTNLTLYSYSNNGNNSESMRYVDVDSDPSTFNSSSATLNFSTENDAKPQCSNIIYAGLYWTGRANSGALTFIENKNGTNKTFDKRKVLIKHAGESNYKNVTARDEDIYYPNGSQSNIYAAYAEVTDYVHTNGIGEYFVADMALSEGRSSGTGFSGGWGLVVVYENSKMKWRDVTLYDGYAYVSHSGGGNTSYNFPISGFNAVQSGDVNIKLGLMASEGDVDISGDFIEIQNAARDDWTRLHHAGNTTTNFFNSSIVTGGNDRSLNRTNNTGVDISMFDVPNAGNLNIANGQTRTKFRYGTSQDTYAIFGLVMAVDAYVPEAEATNAVMSIGGVPIVDGSMVLPGQEIVYQMDIRNRGTEAVNDARLVLPIPYTTEFVNSSAVVTFSPAVNNFYYDPSEGATGSIVWEIGDLPVPSEGPDQILGTLTYTVKVTEDCSILGNVNCSPSVGVGGGGGSTGTGGTSGTSITGFSIIQGYEASGDCIGEPIVTPIEIQIDADYFVANHCDVQEINSGQEYFFCNLGASASIAIGEVSDNFPIGCRFYADYPVVDGVTEEFTVFNDFLADVGTKIYYAVPPGYTSCYYTFKITVKNISSVPSVNNLYECEGDLAAKLLATPSLASYKLYYYTDETGGTPHVSLIPNTDVVGDVTYYVAEGESASCLSPNRVPIILTVNPLPTASDITGTSNVCVGSTTSLSTTGIVVWSSSNSSVATINSSTGLVTGVSNGKTDITYTVTNGSGCSAVSSVFEISVDALPVVAGNITGSAIVLKGETGVSYRTDLITSATSYEWVYSGTGATINNGSNNEITIDFADDATSGELKVRGINSCFNGEFSDLLSVYAVSACQTTMENWTFDTPKLSGGYKVFPEVEGWKSTAGIELWTSGFSGITTPDGGQFCELNSDQSGNKMWQDIAVDAGSDMIWAITYRYRKSSTEKLKIEIGPTDGVLEEVRIISGTENAWEVFSGDYKVPASLSSGKVRFQITSASPGTVGNLIDGIQFYSANSDIEPPQFIKDTNLPEKTINIGGVSGCEFVLLDYTAGVSAIDNCDADPDITQDPAVGTTIYGNTIVTLTAMDEIGNPSTYEFEIVGLDVTNPTASNPVGIPVHCISDVPDADITVVTDEVDNCTVDPIVKHVSDSDNGGLGTTSSPYIVTRTYSVTDDAGNSINVEQIITVIDNVKPVLKDLSVDLSRSDCSDVKTENPQLKTFGIGSLTLPEAYYSDNCTGLLTIEYSIDALDDAYDVAFGADPGGDPSGKSFPEGVSTVYYKVIDAAGNESEIKSFTVTVKPKPRPIGIFFDN
jgi:hypothetical protein